MECCGSRGTTHKKGCPTLGEPAEKPQEAAQAAEKPETAKEPEPAPEAREEAQEEDQGVSLTDDDDAVEEVEDEEPEPSPSDIAADLAEHESGEEVADDAAEHVAETRESKGLDLTQFTPEQLDALQSMIAAHTAKKKPRKDKRTVITLRSLEGKLILNFTKAFKKSVFDEEEQRNVVRTHIKVLLEGDEEYKTILYRDFNNAPRVRCELIGTENREREKEVGETFSAEHKIVVPMLVKYVDQILTLRVPDRKDLLKINAELVN